MWDKLKDYIKLKSAWDVNDFQVIYKLEKLQRLYLNYHF